MTTMIREPETYKAMSVPHASRQEAEDAVNAFLDEVRAAREKYKIANVVVILETPCLKDGETVWVATMASNGDALMVPALLGYALESQAQTHEDRMNRLREWKAEAEKMAAELSAYL